MVAPMSGIISSADFVNCGGRTNHGRKSFAETVSETLRENESIWELDNALPTSDAGTSDGTKGMEKEMSRYFQDISYFFADEAIINSHAANTSHYCP